MAAANASARAQRAAIFASPLHQLTGFCLAVDCVTPGCRGERAFAISDLANVYGRDRTVADVLGRMRCSGAFGRRVAAAWLATSQILNARVRPRRVPLRGPEARGYGAVSPVPCRPAPERPLAAGAADGGLKAAERAALLEVISIHFPGKQRPCSARMEATRCFVVELQVAMRAARWKVDLFAVA
jgi:hypothetical protein